MSIRVRTVSVFQESLTGEPSEWLQLSFAGPSKGTIFTIAVGAEVNGKFRRGFATETVFKTSHVDLQSFAQLLVAFAKRFEGRLALSPFDAIRGLYGLATEWVETNPNFPASIVALGRSLIERALLDAFCRATGRPFFEQLTHNHLGIDFAVGRKELNGRMLGEFLPAMPADRVAVSLTISTSAAAADADSFNELIALACKVGIRRFSLDLSVNGEGLLTASAIDDLSVAVKALKNAVGPPFRWSLNSASVFASALEFKAFWDGLEEAIPAREGRSGLLWVEQPFPAEVALGNEVLGLYAEWPKRPAIVLGVSDSDWDMMVKGHSQGYAGVAHNPGRSGVLQGICNAALTQARQAREPVGKWTFGPAAYPVLEPLALLQHLVFSASLNLPQVVLPAAILFQLMQEPSACGWETLIAAHPDLFSSNGELIIEDGHISSRSVVAAPFGCCAELSVAELSLAGQ